jgi:ATP-binding cassette subfamily B protein
VSTWWPPLRHVVRLTLRADRTTALVLSLLMVAQAAVAAATGVSLRWLVDSAPTGDVLRIAAAVALGTVAYAVAAAGGRVQQNMQLYLVTRVNIALSEEIQRSTAGIPTIDHLERPDYLNRLTRLRLGSGALAALPWALFGVAATVAGLAASLVLLATVEPWVALLGVLALSPVLATRRANRVLREAADASAEDRRREQRLHELGTRPGPAKEVFVAGTGAELNRRADALWQAVGQRETRARLVAGAWQSAGWLCYVAGFAATLLLVAHRVATGGTTVGWAVLVVSLAMQLQGQLRAAIDASSQVAEAGAVIRHHSWLHRYAHTGVRPGGPPPVALEYGIRLDRVSFAYPGSEHDALHDISLWLPAGRTVALVGPNGAGKSTLVKLLTGMCEPGRGVVSVDGRPLAELDRSAWQGSVAGLFQDFAQFSFLARETIGVGDLPRLHEPVAIEEAVDRSSARATVDGLPYGLDTQLGLLFGGPEPSAGQWQRLGLARTAMRRGPLCLVLDEPTAALDPEAEHELFHAFLATTRPATERNAVTVLVSHRLSTVHLADQIVVLDHGRVAETGTHEELLAAGGGYAELYAVQRRAYIGEANQA